MLAQMLKNWIYNLVGMGNAASGGGGGTLPSLIGSLVGIGGQAGNQTFNGGAGAYNGGVIDLTTNHSGGGNVAASNGIGAGVLGVAAIAAGLILGNSNAFSANNQNYTVGGVTGSGDFGRPIAGGVELGVGVAMLAAVVSAVAAAGTACLVSVAAVASAVPVVGWVVAAVVLVVAALLAILNGPKEVKVPVYTGAMADPTSILGNAMWQSYGQTMGSLMATNTLGGGSSTDFSKYMNANLPGTESWQPTIHAGSGSDITADAQALFTTWLPRMNIEQAFGQTWNGQYHGDTAGGAAGQQGIAGISGIPEMWAGSFDKDAPIPKMLLNMGLTFDEVHGIATQIDLQDPATFLTWLQGIVGVVQGFKTVIANLSGGTDANGNVLAGGVAGVLAANADAAYHGGINPLNTQLQGVLSGAGNLSASLAMNGGGTVTADQITQAQNLITLSQTYYNNCVQALNQLISMVNTIQNQAAAFSASVQQVGMTPDQLAFARKDRMGQAGLELAGDQTTADVQTTWDNFMKDANDQLNYLVGILNQAQSGLTSMQALAVQFDNIAATAARNPMDLSTVMGDFTTLQGLITTTGQMQDTNSQAYLTNLGLIQQGSASWYSEALAFLQAVNSAQASLTQGTSADIWQNQYQIAGNDDKSGGNNAQIALLKGKIQQDLAAIKTATDPDTVTQLAGEIRSLLSTYEGFYQPGNAGYDASRTFAIGIEQQLETTGTTALTGMGQTVAAAAKQMGTGGETMETAQQLFQNALDTATKSIKDLNTAVTNFSESVTTKLGKWEDDVGADMTAAGQALTTAMNDFTAALSGPSGPTPSLTDLNNVVPITTHKFTQLNDAIDTTIGKLTG